MQHQKLHRTLLDAFVALGLGVVLFELSSFFSNRWPYSEAMGYPFSYTSYVSQAVCPPGTYALGGCLAYDPFLMALDYAFWFTLSLGFVFTSEIIWMRHGKHTILESKAAGV